MRKGIVFFLCLMKKIIGKYVLACMLWGVAAVLLFCEVKCDDFYWAFALTKLAGVLISVLAVFSTAWIGRNVLGEILTED